jgi:hypothetical protein
MVGFLEAAVTLAEADFEINRASLAWLRNAGEHVGPTPPLGVAFKLGRKLCVLKQAGQAIPFFFSDSVIHFVSYEVVVEFSVVAQSWDDIYRLCQQLRPGVSHWANQ